jgi:hypothetical protein
MLIEETLGMCWEQTEQIERLQVIARRPTEGEAVGGIERD